MVLKELINKFHLIAQRTTDSPCEEAEKLLSNILSELRGSPPNKDNKHLVPGGHYSYVNPEMTNDIQKMLFTDIFVDIDYLQSISRESDILIAGILCQMASFDFVSLLELYNDMNSHNRKAIPDLIKFQFFQNIIDPTSGFLYHAPLSPKNNVWRDDPNHKFQFFDVDSPDLKTPFGKALTYCREEICRTLIKNVTDEPNEIKYDDRPSIIVPSILATLLSTIVPPYIHDCDIGCGFPGRPEVLFTISKLQSTSGNVKQPKYSTESDDILIPWIKLYIDITGFESSNYDDKVIFAKSEKIKETPIFRFMMLFPFIAPAINLTNEMQSLAKHVIAGILGPDPMYGSFLIVWSQLMIYLIPDFTFELFDQIFSAMEIFHTFSLNQKHTFVHSITRFVSILCCHFERYLDQDQTTKLHSFAMLNICALSPEIRMSALKLLRILFRFANDMETPIKSVLYFFEDGATKFRHFYLKLFSEHPSVFMQKDILIPSIEPTIINLLQSNSIPLWQLALLTLASLATDYLDRKSLDDFKKLGIEFIKKSKNNSTDEGSKLTLIFILTMLVAFADIPIGLVEDEYQQSQILLTQEIISEGIEISASLVPNFYYKLHIMFRSVDISTFPYVISMCSSVNNVYILVLILYALIMNNNFSVMMQHLDFRKSFLAIFDTVTEKLYENHLLEQVPNFRQKVDKHVKENPILVVDYLTVVRALLKNYVTQFKEEVSGPLPLCPFVVNTERAELQQISFLFGPLFNLTLFLSDTLLEKHLHTFAINAFSELVACTSIRDVSLLYNQSFINHIHQLSLELPSIMTNLMAHHFRTLFPRFLISSLSPGGKQYFNAITSLLALHPSEVEMRPTEYFINKLWPSCCAVCEHSGKYNPLIMEYLQVIYENCGTFILCCLFYLVEPEKELSYKAFLSIVALAPVLSLYHFDGRSDYVKPLFTAFLRLANLYGQSISNLQIATITELSEILSNHFSFCLEQFLDDALDLIPQFNHETLRRALFVITPWFKQVNFDMENRVISKETELLFMRFSCYSFIDKLLSAIPQNDLLDVNSPSLSIWRALVMDGDAPKVNIVPILISLMNAAENSSNHAVLQPLIRFLYRLQSHTVSDCVTSFLMYSYHFHSSQTNTNSDSTFLHLSDLIMSFSEDNDDSYVSRYTNILTFVLTELQILTADTVVPLIPYLPIIFSYALVNLDLFFDKINMLTSTLFTQLKPLLDDDVIPAFNEAHRNSELVYKTEDLSKIHKSIILKGNVPLPGTNLTQLSRSFSNFFVAYDENLARQYENQLLQWALCCGDLMRATNALYCLQGSITMVDNDIIGLFAKAIFSVSECAEYLANTEHKKIALHAYYMRALLMTLKTITQIHASNDTLFTISSILWIAIESLKCNTPSVSTVFDGALELLNMFLTHPELFSLISVKKEYTGGQFTPGVFWKFHEPWDDAFNGCAKTIFEFAGEKQNISLSIRALNLLIQTNFPTIFSDSPKWYCTALLSLLPWMWTVILTDLNQFLFTTDEVKMMACTHEILMGYFEDAELIKSMSLVVGNYDFDLYEEMMKITQRTVKLMDKDDLPSLAVFFTSFLKFGPSFSKIPLYSIVTQILTLAPEFSKYFDDFVSLTEADLKSPRKMYIELLLTIYKKTERIHKVYEFPHLPLYDRIVAILIPQMYEYDNSDHVISGFDEIRSFPPLLPLDQNIFSNPKLREISKKLRQSKIDPFYSWGEILAKMHTSLIDNDLLMQQKKLQKVKNFNAQKILTEILEEIRQDQAELPQMADIYEDENVEDQDNLPSNPYELIVIKPDMFIPTVEDANYVGDELFEQLY